MPRSETFAHGGQLVALLCRSNISRWWCYMMVVVRYYRDRFRGRHGGCPHEESLRRATCYGRWTDTPFRFVLRWNYISPTILLPFAHFHLLFGRLQFRFANFLFRGHKIAHEIFLGVFRAQRPWGVRLLCPSENSIGPSFLRASSSPRLRRSVSLICPFLLRIQHLTSEGLTLPRAPCMAR